MNYEIATYTCDTPACGDFENPIWDDGRAYCPFCGSHEGVKHTGHRPARWVTVAMYSVDRAYGGPEEGGWWYTCGDPVRGTVREYETGNFPVAKLYESQLRDQIGKDRGYVVRVTAEAVAESFPKERPYYS